MNNLNRDPNAARKFCIIASLLLLLCVCGPALLGDSPAPNSPDAPSVLAFLNQTIIWYRQLAVQQQFASEPSEVLFLSDHRQLADQIVRLSFEFARAQAQALAKRSSSGRETQNQNQPTPEASRYRALADMEAKTDEKIKQSHQEIASMRAELEIATGRKRQSLEVAIAEEQSELDLWQVRRDAVRSMLEFVKDTSGSGLESGSLRSEIEELARTVPAAAMENNKQTMTGQSGSGGNAPVQPAAVPSRKPEHPGLFSLASDLVAVRRKYLALGEALGQTDSLAQSSQTLRAPLVGSIRGLARRGDELASQPDSQDSAVLEQRKKELDELTAGFKQLAATVLPLGKQSILLDLYKRSLTNWRNTVQTQYAAERRDFLMRVAGLGLVLALVLALSGLWRRVAFRYVEDARRRHQLLLLRRFVVWFVMAVIVAVFFSSEFGSLATFAGLITAGVALALQNPILSIVGYFFLIGKHGVRVGDRVQISGVTGDVIDIGLVRIHLMEVSSGGSGARPTGRVVVFSNAVVFQPSAGLFKQIPGTKFVWHEITLTLAPESNYRQVEERMMAAVKAVFADYREKLELQRLSMERVLSSLSMTSLDPESRLRLTQNGLEVVIRYPVDLDHAAEVDDRIARELLDATRREPKLRLVGSGTPNIQAAEVVQPVTPGAR